MQHILTWAGVAGNVAAVDRAQRVPDALVAAGVELGVAALRMTPRPKGDRYLE
jgi:hypothetical protein